MTLLDIAQLGISIFGSISFLMILGESKRNQKIGTVLGLLATPFWWGSAILTSQWITLPIHALYTGGWVFKAYQLWFKKTVKAPSCSKAWQEWDAGLAKADAEFRERRLLSSTQSGKTQHLMNQIRDDDRYMIVYPKYLNEKSHPLHRAVDGDVVLNWEPTDETG